MLQDHKKGDAKSHSLKCQHAPKLQSSTTSSEQGHPVDPWGSGQAHWKYQEHLQLSTKPRKAAHIKLVHQCETLLAFPDLILHYLPAGRLPASAEAPRSLRCRAARAPLQCAVCDDMMMMTTMMMIRRRRINSLIQDMVDERRSALMLCTESLQACHLLPTMASLRKPKQMSNGPLHVLYDCLLLPPPEVPHETHVAMILLSSCPCLDLSCRRPEDTKVRSGQALTHSCFPALRAPLPHRRIPVLQADVLP
eukprot:1149254-Pelagomonas_calceolata.AAC.4